MRELAVCCSSFLQFQIVPENSCLHAIRKHHKFPGGLTARVTPVPIPNTEVKPCRADDTARVTARERRSPPGLISAKKAPSHRSLFHFLPCRSRTALCSDRMPRRLRGGGEAGFGPVEVEADEPTFHEDWERRVFRLNAAAITAGIVGGGGVFRHSIERMDPGHYLTSSYYEHWLTGLATLVVEQGLETRCRNRPRRERERPCRTSLRDRPPRPCPRMAPGGPHPGASLRARKAGRRRSARRRILGSRPRSAQ